MLVASPIHQILDLARWAPSGDNTQPWRFEIVNPTYFVVHGRDTRSDTVYDLDGRASQLSLGALLETAAIAASGHGYSLRIRRRGGLPDSKPTFDVEMRPGLVSPSPLIDVIPKRMVHRGPMSMKALTSVEREALEESVGSDYQVIWFEGWAERWRWAKLLWTNAGLRLRLPEAYEVHRRVIQWNTRFSRDGLPDQALGADALTLMVMRHAMKNWRRVKFLNTWLGATIAPRLLMDLLPALCCAAHFAIVARRPPVTIDDYVEGGRAMQRFWLSATKLGLQHQPAITPLVFSRYVREGRSFTATPSLAAVAQHVSDELGFVLGERPAQEAIWLGRLGHGSARQTRSLRLSLGELIAS